MKLKRKTRLVTIVFLTVTAIITVTTKTFAQRTKVKLKAVGKAPYDTYENVNTLIFMDKVTSSKAVDAAKKLLKDSVNRPRPTEEEYNNATTQQFTFISVLNNGICAEALREGNTAVFDKQHGRFVTDIEYEKTGTNAYRFYLAGSKTPFFYSHDITQHPMEITDDANYYPSLEEPGKKAASTEIINGDKVYTEVEQAPQYPGGVESLTKYVKRILRRPESCKGHVFVSFIVDKDGTILEPVVVKSLGPECDAEALRLMREGHKWIPGQQDGNPVKTRFVFPVRFRTY